MEPLGSELSVFVSHVFGYPKSQKGGISPPNRRKSSWTSYSGKDSALMEIASHYSAGLSSNLIKDAGLVPSHIHR